MRPILFLLALPLLFSCDDRRDLRDYYFPVRDLINTGGLVYAYENTGTLPGPDTEYWYCLGVDLDTALYLSVTKYGPDFSPAQQSRERVRNDAVYLEELTLLPPDSNGIAQPVPTDVLYDRVFPFYHDAAIPTGYRMRFPTPGRDTEMTYVTLNRTFRSDTTITILGREHEAIVFDLSGEVSARDALEGDISPTFGGYEIYAKGLGRVAFERNLGEGMTFGGRLQELLPMPKFAERVKAQQGGAAAGAE